MKVCAVIDIGGYSIRMSIYQCKPAHWECLETMVRPLNLGHDVFRSGALSIETMETACRILADFKHHLKEYGASSIRAIATSAVREANNSLLLLDWIRVRCGIEVEILSSQEEARCIFNALQTDIKNDFIGVMIGTSSLVIYYVREGKLKFCEGVGLGSLRFADEFGENDVSQEHVENLLGVMDFPRRIATTAQSHDWENLPLIILGGGPRALMRFAKQKNGDTLLREPALKVLLRGEKICASQLVTEYGLSDLQADVMPTTATIVRVLLQAFKSKAITFSTLNTRDIILNDWLMAPSVDEALLLELIRNLGIRYSVDDKHGMRTVEIARLLFNKLKRECALAPSTRKILTVASYFHDIGRFVSQHRHEVHGAYLVSAIQLPGLSSEEQLLAASVVRAHRRQGIKLNDKAWIEIPDTEKVTVVKLAAILRLADILARHTQGLLTISWRNGSICMQCHSKENGQWLELYWRGRVDLFRNAFGIPVKLERIED